MSADTTPISPSRFAAALKDLSPGMLRLKLLEIRNSVAHLQYSNDQLRPFADGTAAVLDAPSSNAPDQDCIEALRENDAVIDRMAERIALIRVEVELRGLSWSEFDTDNATKDADVQMGADSAANDVHRPHAAWSDGTFQTGTVVNGQVRHHHAPEAPSSRTGDSLGDLSSPPEDSPNPDGDGGMHL
ncbi:hypothetical protein XA68_17950 [Ophiocordyceps unilateralis]|uniref:Uncharacterized protein n=1 Tax=Ophiocordyceps unilateralis TaxID=268505 RepID=A0A2A9P3P5_OPHUN|nr:hypothetical protein XA68_17950 [Ophiocordyceps unilateralis]